MVKFSVASSPMPCCDPSQHAELRLLCARRLEQTGGQTLASTPGEAQKKKMPLQVLKGLMLGSVLGTFLYFYRTGETYESLSPSQGGSGGWDYTRIRWCYPVRVWGWEEGC